MQETFWSNNIDNWKNRKCSQSVVVHIPEADSNYFEYLLND